MERSSTCAPERLCVTYPVFVGFVVVAAGFADGFVCLLQVRSVLPVPAAMLTRGQFFSSSSRDVRCCPTRPVADKGAGASASAREQCPGLVRASSSGSVCWSS